MTQRPTTKPRLKPFRQVIAEHRKDEYAKEAIQRVLSEEAEGMTITAATTVVIDGENLPQFVKRR